jgi:hypothetical protein
MRYRLGGLLLASLAAVAGCGLTRQTRPFQEPPPPDIKVTRIDYVDTDGFDELLESALVNQDPAIVIDTGHDKPDWDARLNAWIAAWNRGGKVQGQTVRPQAPAIPGVSVDAESLREFRLLIDDLMSRVEESAKAGSAWWAEERTRNRRVALLKPYNLRFHVTDEGHIEIILFNGRYASHHPDFVRSLGSEEDEGDGTWVRGVECSRCKRRAEGRGRSEGKLTSAGPD